MINHKDYFYKGYDISNKNSLEKLQMGEFNPYGNNIDVTSRRQIDYELLSSKTNQDIVKNKEIIDKK